MDSNKQTPASRENAEHFTWGENCQGWNLVRNADLSVIEEMMPPGTAEQIHRHPVAQQFFYILSGDAVMEFGEPESRDEKGTGRGGKSRCGSPDPQSLKYGGAVSGDFSTLHQKW